MSPRQLIEQLERLGTIDPRILAKIRQEFDTSNKEIKPKAVLDYLVKKGQLKESEAARILKEGSRVAKQSLDEFELLQPPAEPTYDTDDLTGGLLQTSTTPRPPASEKSKPAPSPPAQKNPKRPPTPIVQPIVSDEQTALDAGQFDVLDDEIVGVDRKTSKLRAEVFPAYGAELTDVDQFGDDGHTRVKGTTSSFAGKKNKQDQWATKWLYIGFGILGVLLISLAVLFVATMGVKAEDQYQAAKDSFDKLAYLDAAKKFEEYYQDNPKHKYVASAKALRAQCLIANSFSSRNWVETITSADTLLPPLLEDEESRIDEIRDDLAHMLPESLMEVTEIAKKATELTDMETELAKCLDLKKIIDNNVYIPTSERNKPLTAANLAKIDNNVRILQGQIDKEKNYNTAITEIKRLGAASETDKAFAEYKKLTRNYGDLANRELLRNTMLEISLKERELVTPIAEKLLVSRDPRPSPILRSVVLASPVGESVESLQEEIVNFLADGSVYGLQAGDGTLRWRRFVGYQTNVQPELLDQDSLLVSDHQQHDLLLVGKSTGDIIWRTEIGEPFLAPAFNEAMIVVTTQSGKIIQLNRESGEVVQFVKLPQAANVPALASDQDPYIYQVGSYSNLYVLSNQDFSCREVFYLGHYTGSIAIAPQAWSGFILVAMNGGDFCDLLVLKPAKNGLELELVQVIKRITDGPVTQPLQRFGRWMLMTADNGDVRILELQPTDENIPVTKFAADNFVNGGASTQVLTEGSNLWIAGLGISRFRIQRTQGTFQRDEIINSQDTFITPLRKLDDYLFHVRRRRDSGMLSASLVDAKSLAPIWRTDFGGPVVGTPMVAGDSVVVVSNQGDLFQITPTALANQTAIAKAQSSQVVEDLKFNSLVQLPDDTFACFGPAQQEDFLFGRSTTTQSKLIRLATPANHPACPPLAVGEFLIVPSTDGQVTRVDPKNGQLVGTPFQPPISPGAQTEWFEPTLIRDSSFAIASGTGAQEGNSSVLYLLDAANPRSIEQVSSLTLDEPFGSRLVNNGQAIFGVLEGGVNDSLASLAISPKLSLNLKMELPGKVAAGPWLVEQGILLKMDNDQLLMLAEDLSTIWALSIPNEQFAGPPKKFQSGLLVSFLSGKLLVVDPASGKVVSEFDLRQPIAAAPIEVDQALFFSGLDGTLHQVDFAKMSGAN